MILKVAEARRVATDRATRQRISHVRSGGSDLASQCRSGRAYGCATDWRTDRLVSDTVRLSVGGPREETRESSWSDAPAMAACGSLRRVRRRPTARGRARRPADQRSAAGSRDVAEAALAAGARLSRGHDSRRHDAAPRSDSRRSPPTRARSRTRCAPTLRAAGRRRRARRCCRRAPSSPARSPTSSASGRVKGRARIAYPLQLAAARRRALRHHDRADRRTQAEATKGEDATKIGIGAGAGAAIGAILGGGDGAAKGAAIGGAAGTGVVLATRGKEVRLGPGADVTTRLTAPLTVRIGQLSVIRAEPRRSRASLRPRVDGRAPPLGALVARSSGAADRRLAATSATGSVGSQPACSCAAATRRHPIATVRGGARQVIGPIEERARARRRAGPAGRPRGSTALRRRAARRRGRATATRRHRVRAAGRGGR